MDSFYKIEKTILFLSALAWTNVHLCVSLDSSFNYTCCLKNKTTLDLPKLIIPKELILYKKSEIGVLDDDEYIVAPNVSAFELKCIFHFPIEWHFEGSLGNQVVNNSNRMVSFEYFDNGTIKKPCYLTTLTFTSISNEITGDYSCAWIINSAIQGWNRIKIFSGLSPLTISNTTLTQTNFPNDIFNSPVQKLPCAANHPAANVTLFYKNEMSEWIPESNISTYSKGVYFTVIVHRNLIGRIYKCVGTLNESVSQTLYLEIPLYADTFYVPQHENPNTVYDIPFGTLTRFRCMSRNPVDIITNYSNKYTAVEVVHGNSEETSFVEESGYKHQVFAIVHDDDNLEESPGNSEMEKGDITCVDKISRKPIWEWHYKRYNQPTCSRNVSNGFTYDFQTFIPDETFVHYFLANTPSEIFLRAKCLNSPSENWYLQLCPRKLSIPVVKCGPHVYFQMPTNISGLFQWMSPDSPKGGNIFIPFPSMQANGYILPKYKVKGQYISSPAEAFIAIQVPNLTVSVGEHISAQCILSEFIYYGFGFWVFVWENGSHTLVPQSLIQRETLSHRNTFYERASDIIINEMGVSRLACYGLSSLLMVYDLRNLQSEPLHIKPPKFGDKERTVEYYIFLPALLLVFFVAGAVMIFLLAKRAKLARTRNDFEERVKVFFEGYDVLIKDDTDPCLKASSQPYDSHQYEIPLENLNISWDSPLGSGAYGFVLRGTLTTNGEDDEDLPLETTVAVKTVKPNSDTQLLTALMSELKVMMYIGKHQNVVNLVGACTENLLRNEMYIVLEFCKNGSLYKYLVDHLSKFQTTLSGDSYLTKNQFDERYQNVKKFKYELTTFHLFCWTRQIISGMEYLATKKVIHGDLACRNVLLSESMIAKIADFGLSRRLYERCQYVKKSQEPLPWRWMAIESLRNMSFSQESDVWSFGVTMWEIFSLAEVPYKGHAYTHEFLESLENNFRMSKPVHMNQKLYDNIVLQSWKPLPAERPTFQELGETFDQIIQSYL